MRMKLQIHKHLNGHRRNTCFKDYRDTLPGNKNILQNIFQTYNTQGMFFNKFLLYI